MKKHLETSTEDLDRLDREIKETLEWRVQLLQKYPDFFTKLPTPSLRVASIQGAKKSCVNGLDGVA